MVLKTSMFLKDVDSITRNLILLNSFKRIYVFQRHTGFLYHLGTSFTTSFKFLLVFHTFLSNFYSFFIHLGYILAHGSSPSVGSQTVSGSGAAGGSVASGSTAPATGAAFVHELTQLTQLHTQGHLDADEYRTAKRKLLDMSP